MWSEWERCEIWAIYLSWLSFALMCSNRSMHFLIDIWFNQSVDEWLERALHRCLSLRTNTKKIGMLPSLRFLLDIFKTFRLYWSMWITFEWEQDKKKHCKRRMKKRTRERERERETNAWTNMIERMVRVKAFLRARIIIQKVPRRKQNN